jgi:hypothetical protein
MGGSLNSQNGMACAFPGAGRLGISMNLVYWLNWFGAACWIVCFWWMHRISRRQQAVLDELREQAELIASLSRQEHQLIKEVHPTVHEIRDDVADVAQAVRENGAASG